MKKYRPEPMRRAVLLTTLITICIIVLLVLSFFQSIAVTNDYPFSDTYNSRYREVDNTKSFVKRNLLKIWFSLHPLSLESVKKQLKLNNIAVIELEADTAELRKLDADLPRSGREYVAVKIKKDDTWKDADLHYRGDSFYHWGYEKKSYVIRKKDKTKINLINPKSDSFIADKLAGDLARDMFSITSPESKWTGLFINGSFKGIYQEVQDVNDAFAAEHKYSAVMEGETLLFKDSGGAELFNDPTKWAIEAGYMPGHTITDLLDSFKKDASIFSQTDFDYLVNFYTWVSIIHNVHYDKDHNWVIGVKNEKFYPFVNDPWPWFTSYQNGNGIEEINSPLSRLLRKNRTFNQRFSENIWQALEGNKIAHYIKSHSEDERVQLAPVLDLDRYKGGILGNPNGTRGPTSTKQILENINVLERHIADRLEFIKRKLTDTTVSYHYDEQNKYLYLRYSGIAGSYLNLSGDNQTVEYYNEGGFNGHLKAPYLLTSGRKIEPKSFYASVCPTTYRIEMKSFALPDVIHSLTRKKVTTRQTAMWDAEDCTSTEKVTAEKPLQTQNTSFPQLSLTYKDMGIADLFFTPEKVKENITASFEGTSAVGKLKKKRFHDDLTLSLDTPLVKRSEYTLLPDTEDTESFQRATDIAEENGLPTPSTQKITLAVNNFKIGTYVLTDYPGKAFFESNNLSFDADIFIKDGIDTGSETNWKQISESPHIRGRAAERLQRLLSAAREGKDLNKYISVSSYRQVEDFAKRIGGKTMEYALYFDESEGRFRIVPYYYTIQNENDFSFADPLLAAIEKSITNTTSDIPTLTESIGDWRTFKTGNTIRLTQNKSYKVKDTVVIGADSDLVIPQGVTVEIASGKSLVVFGKVTIAGTKEKPVVITSSDKKPFGSFAIVGNKASGSTIRYLTVKNGGDATVGDYYFSGMASMYGNGDISISNSTFSGSNSDDALHFIRTTFQVKESVFTHNHADGIDSDYSNGHIIGSYFIDNGNDGIDFSGSQATVADVVAVRSADKCVSVGEQSQITINNVFFEGCRIGVESKDSSYTEVSNAIFSENSIAAHTYQKKAFFEDGAIIVVNSILIDNNQDLVTALKDNKLEDTISSKSDNNLTKQTLRDKGWNITNKSTSAGLNNADFLQTYAATYK